MWKSLRFKLSVLRRNKLAFIRWAWVRLRGKTRCRFAPMYKEEITDKWYPVGGCVGRRQANGLYLPERSMSAHLCDWREALVEQFEIAEKAEQAKRGRKK